MLNFHMGNNEQAIIKTHTKTSIINPTRTTITNNEINTTVTTTMTSVSDTTASPLTTCRTTRCIPPSLVEGSSNASWSLSPNSQMIAKPSKPSPQPPYPHQSSISQISISNIEPKPEPQRDHPQPSQISSPNSKSYQPDNSTKKHMASSSYAAISLTNTIPNKQINTVAQPVTASASTCTSFSAASSTNVCNITTNTFNTNNSSCSVGGNVGVQFKRDEFLKATMKICLVVSPPSNKLLQVNKS